MSPAWKRIEEEYEGRVTFREVDTDTDVGRLEAITHAVLGLPTTIFQKNGEVVARVEGMMRYPQLKKQIDSLLT